MKNRIIFTFIQHFKNSSLNRMKNNSYSQEGEDLILLKHFADKKVGFYVDVGAFHPVRFSNTYRFYKSGWRGINIEPRPGSKSLFNKLRPRDINLEFPISKTPRTLHYYMFNEPALNGFREDISSERAELKNYQIINKLDITTKTLEAILDEFLPKGKTIDFLTIDVEGMDLEVLESNNWDKYKPNIILVEDIGLNLSSLNDSHIFLFLNRLGYHLFAKTISTAFYVLKEQ